MSKVESISTVVPEKPLRFIRKKEVLHRTGLSDGGLYRLISSGDFPKQRPLIGGDARSVFWVESDVEAWMESKLSEVEA